jgi:RHS repeat-associated protein
LGGWTLNIHHAYDPASNTLFLGDGRQRSAWQLAGSSTYQSNYLVTSEDGTEIYLFDVTSGSHLQTLKPLTGAVKYQFGYDTAGTLVTVTDGSGNVTTIQRDGSEHPTAIVSPFSQVTTLSLDSNGFVSKVTDPAGQTATFINSSGGLIRSRTDWNGNVYRYTYDGSGKLTNDTDPAGGSTTASRTDSTTSFVVTMTTTLGRTSTFQVATNVLGEQFTNTGPSGLQETRTKIQQAGQLVDSSTLPDGAQSSTTGSPDPRWGLQAPIPTSRSLMLGSLTASGSITRTVTLADPGNPFSLASETDAHTVNGRTYMSVFTGSTKTSVHTTPMGRQTTTTIDSLERIGSFQRGDLQPVNFAYDNRGRLNSITRGSQADARTTILSYGSNGKISQVSDPLGSTLTLSYDQAGRMTKAKTDDGRIISYTYDPNGNLLSVTPPGGSAYAFTYGPTNRVTTVTAPSVGVGGNQTRYTYDVDGDLTQLTRPDGQKVTYGYDSDGRLSTIATPTGILTYGYDGKTGTLASISGANGADLSYLYDGALLTGINWTGAIQGSVGISYDADFRQASFSVGGVTIPIQYDGDGLLAQVGTLSLARNPTGLVTATALGAVTDAVTYNGFAEPLTYNASFNGRSVFSEQVTRDAGGRITSQVETSSAGTTAYGYTYDTAGRLAQIAVNGVTSATYTYDSNGNRLGYTGPDGTFSATYDAQDRLTQYGSVTYTYTDSGDLSSRSDGGQTTGYVYDVLGNLIQVTLPDSTQISYLVDGRNRRIGKRVNGALLQGFLYQDTRYRRPVAELDGAGNVVSVFVYTHDTGAPDYMINGGNTYRIVADHLGSPRVIVNIATGEIVQRIEYDAFGNVLFDSSPGFQPFGFAGGLYDRDTKLLRFGVRDYDPQVGRWTAKDPALFFGGDTNLYAYVVNDPVNSADASGRQSTIPGPTVDGIRIDPDAPIDESMTGCDPNNGCPVCKIDTPEGQHCWIDGEDPRAPTTWYQRVWGWVTKMLSGSDAKFNIETPTCAIGNRA